MLSINSLLKEHEQFFKMNLKKAVICVNVFFLQKLNRLEKRLFQNVSKIFDDSDIALTHDVCSTVYIFFNCQKKKKSV